MIKKDYVSINIRTSYFIFAVLATIFFLVGFFSSRMIYRIPEGLAGTEESDCVTYCNLAKASFNSVRDGHCFCDQERPVYDFNNNQTIIITQTLDAGITKSIEVQQGIPQEAIARLQAQQQLQTQQI